MASPTSGLLSQFKTLRRVNRQEGLARGHSRSGTTANRAAFLRKASELQTLFRDRVFRCAATRRIMAVSSQIVGPSR